MKKDKITVQKYVGIIKSLFMAGIVLSLLFTILTLALYENDAHYFRLNSTTPKIYAILMCLFAVTALATMLIAPKNVLPEEAVFTNKRNKLSDLASIICGIAVLATVAARFPAFFHSLAQKEMTVGHPAERPSILRVLFIIFGLISVAFFISVAFNVSRSLHAYLGFGVIIYLILYLLTVYYDVSIPINSPMRMLNQITTVAMLIWFLLEKRFIIETPKPFIYISLGLICTTFCFTLGLSTLISIIFGKMNTGSYPIVGAFEALAFGLWASVRLYSFVSSWKKPAKEETAQH